MIRFLMAMVVALSLVGHASAQLFPNAPWNTGTRFSKSSDTCPNGQCPNATAAPSAGHWTYPGTISNHLEGAHGVPTAGMSRQQMLNLHDSLHEGTAPTMKQAVPVMPVPYAVASYAAPQTLTVKTFGSSGSAASYGSSGGFAVGKLDPQGHVITSIGSTVSPEITKAATGTIETLAIGDRVKFRRTLLAAARQAREAGDITPAQFFMLSAASRNPATLDKMQAAVHEAAIEEGLATTQAIDWDNLISFIEKLIPIIIQLIGLFS